MTKQIQTKYDTDVIGVTRYGRPLIHDIDTFYPLWAYQQYCGPLKIVGGAHFSDAYESAIDQCPTIQESEIYEAYGFDSVAEYQAAIDSGDTDDIALIEGYQYQANASGTGIVAVGHHESLDPLTPSLLRALDLNIQIRTYDEINAE